MRCKIVLSNRSSKPAGARALCARSTMPAGSSSNIWSKLDDYQRRAVEFAHDVKTAALFMEQRTGKTWVTLALIERLASATSSLDVLVVVPLTNVESTWAKLIREELPQLELCRTVDEFKRARGARILLVHYEGLPKALRFAVRERWSLIVYDESQRLKGRATRQARDAHKLRHSSARKLILSGTPIDERPTDLWSQFKFLHPQLFGERWKDFEHDWLAPLGGLTARLMKYRRGSIGWQRALLALQIAKSKRSVDPAKLSQFVATIQPYCMRVRLNDVIDSHGLEFVRVPVKLRGSQRRLYEELEEHAVSKAHKLTAPFKMTLIGKLHQICGGHVIDDDGNVRAVGRAKLRAVRGILSKSRHPVVIFARYIEEVSAIRDALSPTYRVATLTGRTKKRADVIDAFQNGRIDVLVSQQKVGGVGIDLWRACVAIIYSCTYSHIDFDQACKRFLGRQQENKVQIFLPYAYDTVDELILDRVMSKDRVTARVLNQLRRT